MAYHAKVLFSWIRLLRPVMATSLETLQLSVQYQQQNMDIGERDEWWKTTVIVGKGVYRREQREQRINSYYFIQIQCMIVSRQNMVCLVYIEWVNYEQIKAIIQDCLLLNSRFNFNKTIGLWLVTPLDFGDWTRTIGLLRVESLGLVADHRIYRDHRILESYTYTMYWKKKYVVRVWYFSFDKSLQIVWPQLNAINE